MSGFYDRYWEMREGGPHDEGQEVFKCTDCGAVSRPAEGHNGAPDPAACSAACASRESFADWRAGRVSRRYLLNYDAVNFINTHPGFDYRKTQRGARTVHVYTPKGA